MCMEQGRKVMIQCNDLSKTFYSNFGEFKVVDEVDLSVAENEFLILFGPGQCGKTTLINLIAGLEESTQGAILVDGMEVKTAGPDRGVVYQSVALFPWLTVMGNVEYGLKMKGVPKKERQERAMHYIKLVGLEGFEHTYPVKLSGGMKQRVGIARAYCIEPKVMLMDEPFGALDAQTRYLMQKELEIIWQTEKRTVVFVTNNIEEAVYLADRILVLKNCPTGVKAEYEIKLPRPRNYVDKEFLRLRKEITNIMDQTL